MIFWRRKMAFRTPFVPIAQHMKCLPGSNCQNKSGENACTNTAIVASYKFYRKWFLTFYCHGILHRCILSNSYTSLLVYTRTLTLWNYHIWFHNVSGSILIRIWTQQGITAHTTAVLKSTRIKQSLHCSKSLWDILHP